MRFKFKKLSQKMILNKIKICVYFSFIDKKNNPKIISICIKKIFILYY